MMIEKKYQDDIDYKTIRKPIVFIYQQNYRYCGNEKGSILKEHGSMFLYHLHKIFHSCKLINRIFVYNEETRKGDIDYECNS